MATIVFVSESCSKAKFESLRQDNHVVFIDFFKYYICGKLASAHDIHDRHSPYDPNVQYKYLASYANATDRQKVEYIEYPPQDFVLMMSLAQLPPHQAYIAFVERQPFFARLRRSPLFMQRAKERLALDLLYTRRAGLRTNV